MPARNAGAPLVPLALVGNFGPFEPMRGPADETSAVREEKSTLTMTQLKTQQHVCVDWRLRFIDDWVCVELGIVGVS